MAYAQPGIIQHLLRTTLTGLCMFGISLSATMAHATSGNRIADQDPHASTWPISQLSRRFGFRYTLPPAAEFFRPTRAAVKTSPTAAPCACPCACQQQALLPLTIAFKANSATIEQEQRKDILTLVSLLRLFPDAQVAIAGHTDNSGSSSYNLALSQHRARATARILTQHYGIPRSRVSIVGYGEARPIADNKTPSGRAQNRRVEAILNGPIATDRRPS